MQVGENEEEVEVLGRTKDKNNIKYYNHRYATNLSTYLSLQKAGLRFHTSE